MVWLGWALSLVLLGVGFLGVWLPAVPGLALMALGAFVHKLLVPGVLSWWVVAVFAFVAALGFGFDFAATAITSRRAGATKAGVWGAVVGGLVGLFFGLPGLLLGPVAGAAAPAAAIVGKQIVILEQVKFATGSAKILPASDAVLNAVLSVVTGHLEIKRLRIEGHTDNVGAAAMNKDLSGRRAASVVACAAT